MTGLPDGLHRFLEAEGWGRAEIEPLPGDASFRRYFRVKDEQRRAMLMHAPPPHEDPEPFLKVAKWLGANDFRAPRILADRARQGWVLTEDFGDDRVREHLDTHPEDEDRIYREAVDTLLALRQCPPADFAPYDVATYLREVDLLPEWWAPAAGLEVPHDEWRQAWTQVLLPLVKRQEPGVVVLRDYHAENIMLPAEGGQGLIDFQDALIGHPAYDLVSLLQDARRDVSPDLEEAMLARYEESSGVGPEFRADYAVLGAQRNAKIVGIFTRLSKRDGKDRYIDLIPRVWDLLERDLRSPALEPVRAWFDANVPDETRARGGAVG